jgi:ABC transporter substrate binding protein
VTNISAATKITMSDFLQRTKLLFTGRLATWLRQELSRRETASPSPTPRLIPEQQQLLLADELIRLKIDVLFAPSTVEALAAKNATRTIPVIFVSADPIGAGLVESLARRFSCQAD